MQRLFIAAVPCALALACSEYEFSKAEDVPVLKDTAQPDPVCVLEVPGPYVPELTDPCESPPIVGVFDPVVEWEWNDNPIHPDYKQIMAAPAVANLTDDNGDGVIDDNDVPDIVFTTFTGSAYGSAGAINAISGADGTTLWSVLDAGGVQPYSSSGVAIADLDGSGQPSILVSAVGGGVLCLDAAGGFRWRGEGETASYGHPAVGDLEGDGIADVVFGRTVYDAYGNVRWVGTEGTGGTRFASFPADLDGDGLQEVVAGNTVYENDGTVRWTDGGTDGWPAAGDFDLDGFPEVVKVAGAAVWVHDFTGQLVWSFSLTDGGGGPPTVADFDGDGYPEVGVASREYYRVIDTDGTELWSNIVQDYSSSQTGSSVFDFEGDGAAEVVYGDEEILWVYDGATGEIELQWEQHSSGTLYEYPLVVDVDNDGASEIVLASNDYTSYNDRRGIAVIGDLTSSWAPARPVWNQHAYYITHIENDNSVPTNPVPNWTHWNSFRAGNSETQVGLGRPDLKLGPPDACLEECYDDRVLLWIPVENGGVTASAEASVALYSLADTRETNVGAHEVPVVEAGDMHWLGPVTVYREQFGPDGLVLRVDDDGDGRSSVFECVEDNNDFWLGTFPCG